MLYRKCPNCGSNNDPGERCDCRKPKEAAESRKQEPNATPAKVKR